MLEDRKSFGIENLKYFSGLTIVALHSVSWIASYSNHTFFYERTFKTKILFLLGLFNLLLPAVAGAVLRFTLSDYFKSNKLVNYPLKYAWYTCLFLVLLESCKQWGVYGFEIFFSWNVLHMTGVSILIITVLSSISVHLVSISAALCLFFESYIRELLARMPFQVVTSIEMEKFSLTNFTQLFFILLIGYSSIVLLYSLIKSNINKKKKIIISVFTLILSSILSFYLFNMNTSNAFAARIYNLPVGALMGDEMGFHIWPVLPWFPLIAGGFLFNHYLSVFKKQEKPYFFLTSLLACTYLFYYWFFEIDSALTYLGGNTFWSSKLFSSGWELTLATLALFVINYYICYLAHERKYYCQHLVFAPLAKVYGRTILLIYLIMTTLALPLARLFIFYFSVEVNFVLFPVVMSIFCYIFGYYYIKLVDSKSYTFRLRKIR